MKALLSTACLLGGVLLGGCGSSDDAPAAAPFDRAGGCAPTASPADAPQVEADGILYADDGRNVFSPERDVHVPVLLAMTMQAGVLFLGRAFPSAAGPSGGAVQIVALDPGRRSSRCTTDVRWSSRSDSAGLAHIDGFGDEISFVCEQPVALPVRGGEAVGLWSEEELAAVVTDGATFAGAFGETANARGAKTFDVVLGRRGGEARVLGTFDGYVWPQILAQDDRFLYVAGNVIRTIDKQSGEIVDEATRASSCYELVRAGDALWALCEHEIIRRIDGGGFEVVANADFGYQLVADHDHAWWTVRHWDDAASRETVRAFSSDSPDAIVEGPNVRTALLAVGRDELFVATEEAECDATEPVGTGKGAFAHPQCVGEHVSIRIQRRAIR